MSFHHLDQFATIPSPVTRAVPAVRVIGTTTLACGAALLPLGSWGPLAVLLAVVVLVGGFARLTLPAVLARMAGPLGFVLLASVGVLFLVPGEPLVRLGPVAVSDSGFERFTFVLGRAVVALGAAVILVSTTTFPQLLQAFRQLRLPNVVTTALALAYRLVYLLVDEMERLQRAARSRNAGAGRVNRRRLLVGVAAAGLSRAFARGERTHRAMLARGYRSDAPSLEATHWDVRQALVLVALVVLVGSIVIAAHMGS